MNREPDLTAEHAELGPDAAAWVLGALDPGESGRFDDHLRRCVVCRDDVAQMRGAVEMLPLTVPALAAPRSLTRQIKRSIRQQADEQRASARRPIRLRPLVAGGFAAVLAAGAFALAELTSSSSTSHTSVVQARVLTHTGQAYLSLRDGHAELVVRNMPAPVLGKIYEVWLRRPGHAPTPTSALFNVTSAGAGDIDVPGNLRGIQEVLVTPEPLGGSRHPTYPPVISATLQRS